MGFHAVRHALAHASAAAALAGTTVNDVHSKLNATRVARVWAPESVRELQQIVVKAAGEGLRLAVAGGRHAMGGQQFAAGGALIDMTRLTRVESLDPERGLVTVEAGIDWVHLVNHLLWAGAGDPHTWTIAQKQTGADGMSLGGALASNIHGRGLTRPPIVADVESFDLVRADGSLVTCSRESNRELFTLAIGGYGLFGVIARVTLRLVRRHKLQREVTIARTDDLPALFDARIRDGCTFGDFQFATDADSDECFRVGVFSCYRPVDDGRIIAPDQHALSTQDWRRLILLAHSDKSRAFAEYARHYMSTDGQIYWSDTHQLSQYIENYHVDVDRQTGAGAAGSEMITELYVGRRDLPAFMEAVRADVRRHAMNVVYGTVRIIERDDESCLAWAREPWACVVLNLHVDHTRAGIARAVRDMRRLIETAAELGGSYYLTYHRWATREQVERCHPRLREFLRKKAQHDPGALFASDWYAHHVNLLDLEKQELLS